MGVSLWIYLHRGKGQWERKSLAWFERFFAAKDRVLNPSGTRLELVEILIRHEERIPVEICHLNYFRMPILPDGSLDREREEERERTLFEAASDSLPLPSFAPKTSVVEHARGRFAKRRADYLWHWQPSEADLAALQTELGRRMLGR